MSDQSNSTKHFRPNNFDQQNSTANIRPQTFDNKLRPELFDPKKICQTIGPKMFGQNSTKQMFNQECSTKNVGLKAFDQTHVWGPRASIILKLALRLWAPMHACTSVGGARLPRARRHLNTENLNTNNHRTNTDEHEHFCTGFASRSALLRESLGRRDAAERARERTWKRA